MTRVNIIDFIARKLKALVGIVQDTDTATVNIAKGKYVIWKGNPCKASSAISSGGTLSASNLTALTEGVGNDINSKINAITLTDNELITEATLTGYSSIADLQINDDAFYCLECSNDSSSATNIIADFETKNLVSIWRFNYINAPQYAIVSSPVMYLKAGTYKLRATGTVKLKKYVYRT